MPCALQRSKSLTGKFEKLSVYFFIDRYILNLFYHLFYRWAFKMYDKDGSGSIELPEMIEIIGTLYEMEGVPKVCIFLYFQW